MAGRGGVVGRVLVTGVSREVGIAATVARELAARGWRVAASGWPSHDEEQPWGVGTPADTSGLEHWEAVDLADPAAPAHLVASTIERLGGLDAVVAVHARSAGGDAMTVEAGELDACFAVNARASVLLAREGLSVGARRVVLFTTGVHQRPMPDEIAYAMSKAALQGVTTSLAAKLMNLHQTQGASPPGLGHPGA